jgi:2,3-bisphosphoglycerate-dependent phosphoglycerate mutase
MQLYIIRHGQSFNNALWAETGSSNGRLPDPHLTDIGQQQAHHLARYLRQTNQNECENLEADQHNRCGYHFTHLYSSLMLRAVQTGHTIAEALGMPLHVWECIHEWGGIYEDDPETGNPITLPGNNRAFFAKHFSQLVLPDRLQDQGWWGERPYESRESSIHRAQQFVNELMDQHGGTEDKVAIVTHGGFTSMVLRILFNLQEDHFSFQDQEFNTWLRLNNTAITRIDFFDDRIIQMYMNRVDHLPTDLIT